MVKMYSEWASLQHEIRSDTSNTSVLHSFPDTVGKDVANVVVKNLAQSLSIGAQMGEPSKLTTDKEVRWTMEVHVYYKMFTDLYFSVPFICCISTYESHLSLHTEDNSVYF